jgi:predicted ABC-type ATPase
MSKARVSERVRHGGHNIPSKDIERRFCRSLHNLLADFSFAVNNCSCFMNTHDEPTLVFEQQGTRRNVIHDDIYQHFLKESGL